LLAYPDADLRVDSAPVMKVEIKEFELEKGKKK